VAIGRIATGEVEDLRPVKDGRVRSGKAGAAARAKSLSPERRKEVAQKAATARWRNSEGHDVVETSMDTKATEKRATRPQAGDVVLMYPSNQLGDQVRNYNDTLSVAEVIKREFFDNK
jgi:hypothetical protein